jgi:hypothetical protein
MPQAVQDTDVTRPPVLSYPPVLPRPARRARIVRIAILVVAVLSIQLAAVLILHPLVAYRDWQEYLGGGAMGTPFAPLTVPQPQPDGSVTLMGGEAEQRQYLPRALVYLCLFLLTQWWLLSPRGSWRIGLAITAAPPPKRAAVAAGFIGMLLSIGVIATLMELPNWWLQLTTVGGLKTPQRYGAVWQVMAVLWAGWSLLFYLHWRGLDRSTALRRTVRWLLAGTVLELLLATPAHAWVISQRGGECYCQRGTYTGLAFGITAALWLFGPGALLVMLREKQRRETLIETIPSPAPVTTSTT